MDKTKKEVETSRLLADVPTSLKLDFERKVASESSQRGTKIFIKQKIIELVYNYVYGTTTNDELVNELLNTSKDSVTQDIVNYLGKSQDTEIVAKETEKEKGGKQILFGSNFSKMQK